MGGFSERPFKGVILDLDGLLLDTERWALEMGPTVFRSLGLELSPAFLRSLVGVSDTDSARLISAESGKAIDAQTIEQAWGDALLGISEPIPLRPGVAGFLDALDARQLPRAIATNSATARAEWKLRNTGLLDRVGIVVGRDQVKQGKPAPDLYIEAARRLGLAPADCAALDDTDLGVRAAVDAGVGIVVQIPDMLPSREFLAHHQADSLDHARTLLALGG